MFCLKNILKQTFFYTLIHLQHTLRRPSTLWTFYLILPTPIYHLLTVPPHHHQHHQWFQTLEGTLKEKGGGGGGGGCPLMTDPPNPLTSPLTGMLLGLRGEHQEGWRWSLKLKNTCLLLKFILCHLKNF